MTRSGDFVLRAQLTRVQGASSSHVPCHESCSPVWVRVSLSPSELERERIDGVDVAPWSLTVIVWSFTNVIAPNSPIVCGSSVM